MEGVWLGVISIWLLDMRSAKPSYSLVSSICQVWDTAGSFVEPYTMGLDPYQTDQIEETR